MSPWEGGSRTTAAIWSNKLKKRQRVSNQLIHISDWLPTIGHIAGFKVRSPIDGYDMWDALSTLNDESPRNEVLLSMDTNVPYSSYINREYKYMNGSTSNGQYDGWISSFDGKNSQLLKQYGNALLSSETGRALLQYQLTDKPVTSNTIEELRKKSTINCNYPKNNTVRYLCQPLSQPCLFNIYEDPCEIHNLATVYPEILNKMKKRMLELTNLALPARNKPIDPLSNPQFYNYTWTWWYDVLARRYCSSSEL